MGAHCRRCDGAGWVCETHPFKQWSPAGCMCDAGIPCVCNDDPQHGGFDEVIARSVNHKRSAMITAAAVIVASLVALAVALS